MKNNQWKLAGCFLVSSVFVNANLSESQARPENGNIHHIREVDPVQKNNRVAKTVLDFSVLPVVKGNVAQYLPTPYGNLGGLLLTDGTQIMFSTMFGEIVKSFVHPGQDVVIRGLKAYSLPFVQAFEIINQRGEQIEEDSPEANFSPVPITGPDLSVNGTVKQVLYNLQGEKMGVVLKDGTVIYIRSSDVKKLDFILSVGQKIYVSGMGNVNSLGKALQARIIGKTGNTMVELSQFNVPPAGAPAGSPSYDYIPQ